MNQTWINSLVTMGIRRGLSMLGATGAAVSDDWVTQTASLVLMGANELYQWWKLHKAEKAKAGA